MHDPLQVSYPSILVGSSFFDFIESRCCVLPYKMHGHSSPRQQIPKFENSHSPLLHPPPLISWFGWVVWPGWWYALRSSGWAACDVVALVGGGKYGDLGDCRGFSSGAMGIVSLRGGASGFTFRGSGPGEFGGGELGGSVYEAYCWVGISIPRCCSWRWVYDCVAYGWLAYEWGDIGVLYCGCSGTFAY